MPGKKQKGSAFEREIARDLGTWWCGDPNFLWRTRGSGAHAQRIKKHYGDIAPIDSPASEFPLTIECKFTKSWSLVPILEGRERATLYKYWRQLEREKRPGTLGVLLAKGNRTPIYAAISQWDALRLHVQRDSAVLLYVPSPAIVLMRYDDFKSVVPQAGIRELYGPRHSDWT